MGFLSRLLGRGTETRAAADFYAPGFGVPGTVPGAVSPHMAENLSTVVACVNAIGGGLGALPALVYRSEGDRGRVEVPNHPVARLIRAPNPHQTWIDFVEWLMAEVLLQGNALAVIEHDGAGRVTALRPVPWSTVQVSVLPSGTLAYDVVATTAPWGGNAQTRRYLAGDILHLRDRSDDGVIGRSRISRAGDVMRSAIGLQTYSLEVWNNAATPSGMVALGASVSPEGFKRMQAHFESRFAGAHNAKRVIFADAGSKFEPFSVSPEDAEVLASRRFSVEELCRLFNCPPPIVQSYEFNTFTNATQANTWFAVNTLRPWARKIEAEFSRTVFTDPAYSLEIDLSGLMRGDYATRWTANVAAVSAGILTVDEVREQEGFGPLPAGAAKPRDATPPQGDVDTDPPV